MMCAFSLPLRRARAPPKVPGIQGKGERGMSFIHRAALASAASVATVAAAALALAPAAGAQARGPASPADEESRKFVAVVLGATEDVYDDRLSRRGGRHAADGSDGSGRGAHDVSVLSRGRTSVDD